MCTTSWASSGACRSSGKRAICRHSPLSTPVILHDAPVPVFLPVLESPCVAQEHGPIVHARIGQSRGWVFTTSDFGNADVDTKGLTLAETAKIAKNRVQLSKSG